MASENLPLSDPFFEPPRDKHHEFTYTWTIENLAFWAKRSGEYLETDVFRPRLIDDGIWQLRLYPRSREEPLLWYLERVCGDKSDTAQLSFSIKIYSNQVLHYQYQADDHVFNKGPGAACATKKILKDMVNQASVHHNPDVLKVVCKMWRRCPAVALSEKLASCTRIEIGRLAFSWHFTQFSRWDPVEHHTHAGYTYGNAVRDILSCKMQLYSNRDPIFERLGIIVRFRRPPTEDFLVAARISVLNKDGKSVVSHEETVFEKAGDDLIVWVIPVFIDKRMLIEESSEYLPYDELTLLSEFNIPVRNIYSVRLQYSIASGAAQQNLETNWNSEAIATCRESVSTQASDDAKTHTDTGMQTEDVSETEQEQSFDGLDFFHQLYSTEEEGDHLVKIDKHTLSRLLDQLDLLDDSEIPKQFEKDETVGNPVGRVFVQKTNDYYDSETFENSATSGDYSDSEENDDSGSESEEAEENNRSEELGKQLDNPKPSRDRKCHQQGKDSQESNRSGNNIDKEVVNPKLLMEAYFSQNGAQHPSPNNYNLEVEESEHPTLKVPNTTSEESGSSEEGSTSENSNSSYEGSTSEDSDCLEEPSILEEGPNDSNESPAFQVESYSTEGSTTSSDEDDANKGTDSQTQDIENSSADYQNDYPARYNHFTRFRSSIEHLLVSVREGLRNWSQEPPDAFRSVSLVVLLMLTTKLLSGIRIERHELPRLLVLFYADTLGDPHMPELVWSYSTTPELGNRTLQCPNIVSNMSTENAWVVLALAVAHQDSVLRRTALHFLEVNKDKTLASDEWRKSVELKIDSAHGEFRKRFMNEAPNRHVPSF